jgi:cytochrome oxidase Cu insertion factor (SCO1/SenC/PrrC family)
MMRLNEENPMSFPVRLIMFGVVIAALAAVVIAALAAPVFFSQEKGKSAEQEQPGLKVGESAPKFTLKDQEGSDRSLNELLEKGPVALVFYRSADW